MLKNIESDVPSQELKDTITKARMSPDEKIRLFTSVFMGRDDVFALRWQSGNGKSGYSPACVNKWIEGVCRIPAITCKDCLNKENAALTEEVLEKHLKGEIIVGIYPLRAGNKCLFLAFDCDGANWSEDSRALADAARSFGFNVYRERSRSGLGGHVWLFFSEEVQARYARLVGGRIITKAKKNRPENRLISFDRMFPNQDTMPEGGYGNLIALPLQKQARMNGNSVFIDDRDTPYDDQWQFLRSVKKYSNEEIQNSIHITERRIGSFDERLLRSVQITDVSPQKEPDYVENSQEYRANLEKRKIDTKISGEFTIRMVDNDGFVLPRSIKDQIKSLATFKNPAFYQAQKLRLSTRQIPGIVSCCEERNGWLCLPRIYCEDTQKILMESGYIPILQDERSLGRPIDVSFIGALSRNEEQALEAMVRNEYGTLYAPKYFDRIPIACAMIASRRINTLILVHRKQLYEEWIKRTRSLLSINYDKADDGFSWKGRKLNGLLDIVMMQSISRSSNSNFIVERYGQILVDECHHAAAYGYEHLLRQAPARYLSGLTYKRKRRDRMEQIVYMQCGPIRVKVTKE
jgi:hypothetical protein